MKKVKMNEKEEIYVINQPKHIIASLILMDTPYPLEKSVHESLFKLGKISDLIFIFSQQHFPVETASIRKDKFTTLYQGCAFMETGNSGLAEGVMKLLLYCQEVFDKHLGYNITLCSQLGNITDITTENIVKLQSSAIVKPVFKASRLSAEELYEFYKDSQKEKEVRSMDDFCMNIIFSKILGEEFTGTTDCRYCTWKSESPIMFFKNGVIKIILDKVSQDEYKNIVKTFTDPDIRYLFANLTELCGISNINYNIDDLEIGKINYDSNSIRI